jgi:SPP1 family predicted phage head-tail adaptor
MPGVKREPGEMRHRIQIEYRAAVREPEGGEIVEWAPAVNGDIWAHQRMVTGTERVNAGQPQAYDVRMFTIWYREDLSILDRNETRRIVFGKKNYDILQIDEIGYREQLVIMARSQG